MTFRKVHFRIDSDYKWSVGFSSDTEAQRFHQEAAALFCSAGWKIEPGERDCISDTAVKEMQNLYLHPMDFSGVIDEEEIPHIEALLATAQSFHCRGTDLYGEFLDMSDDAYLEHLESKRSEITAALLQRYRTRRRNLYYSSEAALGIADRFSVNRLCDQEGRHNKAYLFVADLVEELISQGKLVTAQKNGAQFIRTAMKVDKNRTATA